MRISLSRRAAAELEYYFEAGVGRFGVPIAERTFSRVKHLIFDLLPANPELGTYRANRDLYECVVARTPFVIFYRYDDRDEITIAAIFNQSQARDWFEV
jgi:plasmid stabilization system protein ParE